MVLCKRCGEYKDEDDFFSVTRNGKTRLMTNKCRQCRAETDRMEYEKKKEKMGGAIQVRQFPGQYVDEYQRRGTFELLTLLGWKYNQSNGVWYKNPMKNENGEWAIEPNQSRIRKHEKCILKSKLTLDTLPVIKFERGNKKRVIDEKIINEMMKDYFLNNMSFTKLQNKYIGNGITTNNIQYYVRKIYKELEKREKNGII